MVAESENRKKEFRESVLVVLSGLLGGVMGKAVDNAWNLPLWLAMFVYAIASIIVFFLAYWIIKNLPR